MKSLRAVNLNLLPILHELLIRSSVTEAANALFLSQSATGEALGRLIIKYYRAGRLSTDTGRH
ncbi:MAG TPA: hypothetical protein EYQ14_27965 [Gammaproteobacteria bacterium]|nr:hypothetical protein [Gammaproteobacteria bacterium]HIL97280.1 hypothetical protein [Pseudomonadales bacterium]